MIYTSNYFNKNLSGKTVIRISVSAPKGITYTDSWLTVAPDWNTLLKPYKDGAIDNREYTKRYLKQLNDNKTKVINEYRIIKNKYKDAVLVCWCKKGNFCHRRILANWLEEQGFDKIEEL